MRSSVPPFFAACCLPALLAVAFPAAAQETRVAPEGHVPPPAQIGDVAWLAGQWSGEGIMGHAAHEDWLPPTGDTMVGSFVQENGEGGLMFTEHMYIREVDGSLQVELKHFNPDMTGWEEREDMVTWRLVSLEPCAAYFSGLTYRCANGENTADGIVVAVRMRSSDGDISELVFTFDPILPGEAISSVCADAISTPEMSACYGAIHARAEARREAYFALALDRHSDLPEVLALMEQAEAAFLANREAECDAIAESFAGGSIRGLQRQTCRIRLTDERTHTIWRHWLHYADSTPPALPEPLPSM